MDESIFSFIDVDEGGLNIMQDICDTTAIDVACQLAVLFSR